MHWLVITHRCCIAFEARTEAPPEQVKAKAAASYTCGTFVIVENNQSKYSLVGRKAVSNSGSVGHVRQNEAPGFCPQYARLLTGDGTAIAFWRGRRRSKASEVTIASMVSCNQRDRLRTAHLTES